MVKPTLNTALDVINYLKPLYAGDKVEELLIKAEELHLSMCKKKGLKINTFSLTHIETIDEDNITFVGEDYYGESLNAIIPITYFNEG